jgi:hypothetical protein
MFAFYKFRNILDSVLAKIYISSYKSARDFAKNNHPDEGHLK